MLGALCVDWFNMTSSFCEARACTSTIFVQSGNIYSIGSEGTTPLNTTQAIYVELFI